MGEMQEAFRMNRGQVSRPCRSHRASRRAWIWAALGAAVLATSTATAQQTVVEMAPEINPDEEVFLSAQEVSYDTRAQIAEAEGAIIYYGPRALSAEEIIYDRAAGSVSARGNVTFLNDNGIVITADSAQVTQGLQDGDIQNPQLVLPEGARLVAVEGRRVDGRYSALTKAVYSPCKVCIDNSFPLWRIRAAKVVHDEEARRIVYQGATFDVYGQPIAYLPYFAHADPTVVRQSGLLAPEIRASGAIGYSIKTPYYINLAPDRDLTLTPFVTSDDGLIMEGEYRALTETGSYTFAGSLTHNNETGSERIRGHIDADGRFKLAPNLEWGFDVNLASDDTYLARYDYSDEDRVASRLYAHYQTDRVFAQTNAFYFQSFRVDEPISAIPRVLPELRLRAQALESPTYGVATLSADVLALHRRGGASAAAGAADPATGRDVLRAGVGVEWERPLTFDFGLRATPFALARASAYKVHSDSSSADPNRSAGRLDAAAGVDLRYPMVRRDSYGQHVLEPIVQFVAAPYGGISGEIPNEDSLDFEFDDTNLFAAGRRFPGYDRFESGPHMNVGLRYDFQHDSGLEFEAVYGRVFRPRQTNVFASGAGLNSSTSDHVTSMRLKLPLYLELAHRMRIDADNGDVRRNEIYVEGEYGRVTATASYVALSADPAAGVTQDRAELALAAEAKLSDYWTFYGAARRDLERDRFVTAAGGLRYQDECFELDLSVTRRFNERADAEKRTDFGLIVRLKNLGF